MAKTEETEYLQTLDGYRFHITSQLIEDYETVPLFQPTNQRAICYDGDDFLFFCSGYDAKGNQQVYLFREPQNNQAGVVVTPLERSCITSGLGGSDFVLNDQPGSIKAYNGPKGYPMLVISCKINGSPAFVYSEIVKNKALGWKYIYIDQPATRWDGGLSANGEPYLMMCYQNNADSHVTIYQPARGASRLALPVDSLTILDVKALKLGALKGVSVLILGRDAAGHNQLFVTDNRFANGLRPVYVSQIHLPDGLQPSVIGVINEGNADSELFVAANAADNAYAFEGTRVFHVKPQPESNPLERVYRWECSPAFDAACEARHFDFGRNGIERNVWLTGDYGNEGLWLLRAVNESNRWDDPVPLMELQRDSIAKTMVLHNPHNYSLDVFTEAPQPAGSAPCLQHYWCDPESTLWLSNLVSAGDMESDEVREVTASATYLHVTDADGRTAAGKDIEITATQEISVRVDDTIKRITPGSWITATTDETGSICISTEAENIDTPVYLVSLPGSSTAIRIESTSFADKRLAGLDFGSVETVAATDVATYTNFVRESSDQARGLAGVPAVSLVPRLLKAALPPAYPVSRRRKQKSAARTQFLFACAFDGKSSRVFSSRTAYDGYLKRQKPVLLGGTMKRVLRDLKRAIGKAAAFVGDVVHATAHFVKEATSFVVEKVGKAVRFVFNMAGELIHVLVETVEQCWAMTAKVLRRVWDNIKKAVKYIGYLFDWKETRQVMKALQSMGSIGLSHLENEFGNSNSETRTEVNRLFDSVDQKIASYAWNHGYNAPTDQQADSSAKLYQRIQGLRENQRINSVFNRCKEKLYEKLDWGEEMDYALDYVLPDKNTESIGRTLMKQHLLSPARLVKDPKSLAEDLIKDARLLVKQVKLGVGRNMERVASGCSDLRRELEKPENLKVPLMGRLHRDITGSGSMTRGSISSLLMAVPVHFMYRKFVDDRNLVYNSALIDQLGAASTPADIVTAFKGPANVKAAMPRADMNPLDPVVKLGDRLLHNQLFLEAIGVGWECYSSYSAHKKGGATKGKLKIPTVLAVSAYAMYKFYAVKSKLEAIASLKNEALNLKIRSIGYASAVITTMSIARARKEWLSDRKSALVLATVSSVAGLLPLIINACSYATSYNGYDYADMVWKLLNGVKQSSVFMLQTEPHEAGIVLGVSTVATIILIMVETEHEDPSRLVN